LPFPVANLSVFEHLADLGTPARRIARKPNARQREYLDIPMVASEGAILVSSAAKPVLAPSPLNLLLPGNQGGILFAAFW